MKQISRRIAAITILCVMVLATMAAAQSQTDRAAETSARVIALEEFHKVIFKIWHTAWPNRDVAMLKQLAPEVASGGAAVVAAKLPGILREKQGAWDSGVQKLDSSLASYAKAAAGGTDAELMAAAEALHTTYEGLVRVIRPVMKEVEAFHAQLYLLYHYYMPEYAPDSIAVTTARMQKAMESLNAASLPARLENKSAQFAEARGKLSLSVDALAKSLTTKERDTITKAIKEVHSRYQALESVFN